MFIGTSAIAQTYGRNLSVTIDVRSVSLRGDTVAVTSRLTNLLGSQESLQVYLADAPGGVIRIDAPAPTIQWDTSNNFRSRPTAYWSSLHLVAPGATTPDLYYESIGVPGIVTYWAQGHFGAGDDEDQPDSSATPDILGTQMITGSTVGVTPWPVDRTPAALLARLRTLAQASCATPLVWITDSNLCTQIVADLDQAETYRANGQVTQAKSTIDVFITRLGGTGGAYASGVTSSGYWLLVPNATIIKDAL
jgi:hypothetical protein